jgi:DNA polymerase-3 subunit delta'
MALRPLIGHRALRAGLAAAWLDGRLPASLLLQGRRGIGKQRLALWLGTLMVCERVKPDRLLDPCGNCQGCRYASRVVHPDLHWYFPRPRLTGDPSWEDVAADISEAIAERVAHDGLWSAPPGTDGLHVATVRALLHQATLRPAMAQQAVFVVGDAERMVSQEGADQAANAFLKLLEEPPPTTSIVMTTSEPGALLPTIRSRVVTVRVAPLARADVEDFLDDMAVHRRLGTTPRPEALARANGAPGELLSGESTAASFASARRLLEAALQPASPAGAAERIKAAARQGVAGARGSFTDTLDALTVLISLRVRQLVAEGQSRDARRSAAAMSLVEDAKLRARGNVSPQLLGASLLQGLHRAFRS